MKKILSIVLSLAMMVALLVCAIPASATTVTKSTVTESELALTAKAGANFKLSYVAHIANNAASAYITLDFADGSFGMNSCVGTRVADWTTEQYTVIWSDIQCVKADATGWTRITYGTGDSFADHFPSGTNNPWVSGVDVKVTYERDCDAKKIITTYALLDGTVLATKEIDCSDTTKYCDITQAVGRIRFSLNGVTISDFTWDDGEVTPITIQTVNPDGASATLGTTGEWTNPVCSGGELPEDAPRQLLNFSVDFSFIENLNAPDSRAYITIKTGDFQTRLKIQRRSRGRTDGYARLQIGVRTGLGSDKGTEEAFWHNDIPDYHYRYTAVATYDEATNKTTLTSRIYDLDQVVEGEVTLVREWTYVTDGKLDSDIRIVTFWAETNPTVDSNCNYFAGFYMDNFKLNGELSDILNDASNWDFGEYADDLAIHTYSDYVAVNAATCGADGTYERTCSICQAKQTKSVSATGDHQYGEAEIITPAGCLTKGTQQQVCSVCGDVYTKSIKATGHTEPTEYTVDVEPTTTTVGSKSKHCSVCGEIIEGTEVEIPVKSEETTTAQEETTTAQEDTTTKAEDITTKADDVTTKADDTSSKSGCGSTLGVSALALVLVSTLGMGLKRKH